MVEEVDEGVGSITFVTFFPLTKPRVVAGPGRAAIRPTVALDTSAMHDRFATPAFVCPPGSARLDGICKQI